MSDLFLKTTNSDGTDLRLQEVGASDPAPTAPNLMWTLTGLITPSVVKLAVRLDGVSSDITIETSETSDFANTQSHGPYATQDGPDFTGEDYYLAQCRMEGLSPDTLLYARISVDGTAQTDHIVEFRTPPAIGDPHSFSFGFASCNRGQYHSTQPYSNHPIWEEINNQGLRLFVHMGDWGYPDNGFDEIRNPGHNDGDHPRYWWLNFDGNMATARQKELFRTTPISYSWDDHDFGPNNGMGYAEDGTKRVYRDPAVKAYRTTIPHDEALPGDTDAVYWSYVIGRVRFMKTDERSEAVYNTGDRYGATQLQWIKDQIMAAKAAGQIIVWELSVPWIISEDSPHGGHTSDDAWPQIGFDDRDELGDFVTAEGMSNSIVAIVGDMHALAADDGRNNEWGGFPVLHGAPIDQGNSTKGGPYQIGPFTNSENQWAKCDVTDNGGDTIAVDYQGYDVGAEIGAATLSLTMQVPEGDTVTRTGVVTRDGDTVAGADVVFITRANLLANATAQTTTDASGAYSAEIPTGEEMVGIALEGADGDSTPFTEGA